MLLEHFFRFLGLGDKHISYTMVVDVNSLMPLFVLFLTSEQNDHQTAFRIHCPRKYACTVAKAIPVPSAIVLTAGIS